jgi:hypothetical protein
VQYLHSRFLRLTKMPRIKVGNLSSFYVNYLFIYKNKNDPD